MYTTTFQPTAADTVQSLIKRPNFIRFTSTTAKATHDLHCPQPGTGVLAPAGSRKTHPAPPNPTGNYKYQACPPATGIPVKKRSHMQQFENSSMYHIAFTSSPALLATPSLLLLLLLLLLL
jgi:hypothetical protein